MKKKEHNMKLGLKRMVKGFETKHKAFQSRLRTTHKTLYAFLGGVGVVMFWHGLWEGLNIVYLSGGTFSFIGNPAFSMTVGIVILAFTGLFVLELVGREAQELEDAIDDVQDDIDNVQEDLEDVQEDLAHGRAEAAAKK
jgi:hypothetical protein